METNHFIKMIDNRRSVRKFERRPVEEEKVDLLLHAALTAPSAMNRQEWEFAVVTDPKLLESLSKLKPGGAEFLKDAPLAVVVMGDERISDKWIEDGSIAATYVQLAAESLGLGSCWVEVRGAVYDHFFSSERYVQQLLGEDVSTRVLCVLGIGYEVGERVRRALPVVRDKVRFFR